MLLSCSTTGFTLQQKQNIKDRIDAYQLTLSGELIDYFSTVAFGSEYSGGRRLVAWNNPVRIEILGAYTTADSLEVAAVLRDLNGLLNDTELHLVEKDPNIQMLFTGQEGFNRYAPDYARSNSGYFNIRWHPKTKFVTGGRILIRTEGVTPAKRNHVIREEITQILGLMNDSPQREESIFFQGYSEQNRYSPIDKQVLQLWDALKPLAGSNKREIEKLLKDLARNQ